MSTISRVECRKCGNVSESYARPGRCIDDRCNGEMVEVAYIRADRLAGATRRRFQINPGPLKLRGEIPKYDMNAGRCEAMLKDGSGRCLHNGKRQIGGRWLCGTHARAAAGSGDEA